MKKRELRLPRTKKVLAVFRRPIKRAGSIEWAAGLFFLLFLVVLVCAEIQLSAFQATSLYLEDALAASNLASAVIDVREYGISHTVKINNPIDAYERYLRAVKENLQLNENWECSNKKMISGQVIIEKYIVYNVAEDVISVTMVTNDGCVHAEQGMMGSVTTPDGTPVEKTGIYSEISFPVEGLFGITVQAHKGKLVDIATESSVQ